MAKTEDKQEPKKEGKYVVVHNISYRHEDAAGEHGMLFPGDAVPEYVSAAMAKNWIERKMIVLKEDYDKVQAEKKAAAEAQQKALKR